MSNPVTTFRLLIIISLVVAVLGSMLDALMPGLLPAELARAYESVEIIENQALPSVLLMLVALVLLLVAGLVATIGLLFFKPWSRSLALWTSVLAVLAYPLLGPAVYSSWAYMLIEVSMITWGAVLAMAYYSEVRSQFDRKSGDSL